HLHSHRLPRWRSRHLRPLRQNAARRPAGRSPDLRSSLRRSPRPPTGSRFRTSWRRLALAHSRDFTSPASAFGFHLVTWALLFPLLTPFLTETKIPQPYRISLSMFRNLSRENSLNRHTSSKSRS